MRFLKRHTRLLLSVLVVLGIAAVAVWPEAMEVDLADVEHGPLRVTIDEDGETRIRDRFVISAPVTGHLQRIDLEPGDRVVRGQTVLARFTPTASPLLDPRSRTELTAAVEAARAAVGGARAERERTGAALTRAQSTLRRQQELAEVGAISRDDLEAAQTAVTTSEEVVRAADFTVARAEYELQLAQARLQEPGADGRTVPIVAPVTGVVLRRHRHSEAVVPAGEPLLEIGDPERLEVVADVLSTDAVRISRGDMVLIEQWGGEDELRGRVRLVEPSGFMKVSALGVEERRVNIIVDFDDPAIAAQRLGDGYRVGVRVVVWQEDDVLMVPVGSLFRRGNDWAVFVTEEERARLQMVQLGQRNGTSAQILDGLTAGQSVVLYPPDTLADGTRVVRRDR
jgi:HlyD family secretion protein